MMIPLLFHIQLIATIKDLLDVIEKQQNKLLIIISKITFYKLQKILLGLELIKKQLINTNSITRTNE